MASSTLSGAREVRHVAVDEDDAWRLAFDRRGNFDLAVPDSFEEADWDLSSRVVRAVRRELDPEPPTTVLPMTPTVGVEDTQPISPWFLP